MTVLRPWLAALAITTLAAASAGAQAQAPAQVPPEEAPAQTTPAPVTAGASTPTPGPRVFGADAGLILNAIRPAAVDDFEQVLGRLAAALAASPDPVRQRQAAGWRVFRATEPGPNDSVLFVFVIDPAVPDADYGVARVLAEAFPDEAGALYALYTEAFAPGGQTLLNLEPEEAFELPAPIVTPPVP